VRIGEKVGIAPEKMITTVHHKSRAIDQWTGEAFNADIKFKIPVADGKKWKGCYATPSSALAALKAYIMDSLRDKPDHQSMLEDFFQASLRREYDPDPRTNSFVIQAAPHFTELVDFGGTLSLEAYHDKYNHDLQRRLFKQVVPRQSQTEEEGAGADAAAAAAAAAPSSKSGEVHAKPWHVRSVSTKASATETDDQTQILPRCVKGWVDFLREQAEDLTGNREVVVVYFSARDRHCFALGSPKPYFSKANKQASEYFGLPVFGPVKIFKHAAIKLPGENKRKKDEEPVPSQQVAHKETKQEAKGETPPPSKKPKETKEKEPVNDCGEDSEDSDDSDASDDDDVSFRTRV